MRKPLKFLAVGLAIALALPPLSYVAYDLTQFQSQQDQISSLISSAATEDREPPEKNVGLLYASIGRDTSSFAARLLMNELGVPLEHKSPIEWQVQWLLWSSFAALHLSESERVTIILSLASTARDRRGVAQTAQVLFGRPPSELSLDEAATIIALTRVPGYSSNPEGLALIRDALLKKYAVHS